MQTAAGWIKRRMGNQADQGETDSMLEMVGNDEIETHSELIHATTTNFYTENHR